MRNYYFVIAIFYSFFLNAQIINIPDANFKAKLLSASMFNTVAVNLSGFNFKIDSNNDNQIQVSEAQQVSYLNVSFSSITNLSGIENFTNLLNLQINNNLLTNIDVSTLINLKELLCNNNYLTNIDLSGLTNLETLDCQRNLLTNIVLTDLTNLFYLNCTNNSLTTLNTTTLNSLEYLFCESNQLTNLNVSQNIVLRIFNCQHNQLTNIDVSDNLLLEGLYCTDNSLTSIDLSQNLFLIELNCDSNQLTYLDVSQNVHIYELLCQNNFLESLNIKNSNLESWYNLDFSNNLSLQYICADENDITMVQQKINSYGYSSTCHVNSYCSFTPNGTFYEISGNTKLDLNTNGCDVSDVNYSNLYFSLTDGTNSSSLIANQTGNYYIPISAGNHTITPNLENSSYFNISPTSFTANFPTQVSPFNQDFCVTANGIKHDVEVILIPIVPARPGFDAIYKLIYRNKGNQVENGNISLTFDDTRLDYVSSNPVFNSSAVNNFTWNYINLQPFESRVITLLLNVNSPMETPAVNNGDQLDFLAQITPFTNDEVQNDNIFALKQIVVGSYDPNDKMCLEGSTITPSEVGKYVHYVIRFENTGTFPAENIVVKDMIDLAKFDIATLVPLKSSHDFYTRINGNKVEFIFENINLDFNDATNDGYVVFKIKTLSSLVLGDTFTNNANIYFDYNFPITTNTYTTTVAALSTQDFDFGTYFTLYPNPAKDVLNIQAKQDLQVNSIEIYNQLGQIVMATTNAINSVDVANLASGTYFVKVNTEKGSANAKFVKE
jgi:hypothetical protein